MVITTANRGDLPRFGLPGDNTLLLLVWNYDQGGYNGEMAISLGFLVAAITMSVCVGVSLVALDEGPSQPLYDRLGLG